MSEYRRQIGAGATVAVAVAFALALGLGAFFPQATMSASQTTSYATSGTVSGSSSSSFPQNSATSTTTLTATVTSTAVVTSATAPATSTTSQSTISETSTTGTVTVSSTTTTTATVTVTTKTCVNCGAFQTASANLTVASGGGKTLLSLTIVNTEGAVIQNLTVSIGSVPVVLIPTLAAGAHTWVSIQVPGSMTIEAGETYLISMQGTTPSGPTEATISVQATG